MSYILEALKKAEAERQLGGTPTIHAPVPDSRVPRGRMVRGPLVAALAAMGAVIVVLGVMVWRQASSSRPAAPVPAAASAPAPSVVPAAVPVAAPVPASVVPVAAPTPTPTPTPVAPAPASAARAASAAPAPAAIGAAETAPAVPAQAVPAARSTPPAAAGPGEEPVQALRDLPEPIRRAIPAYSMDGYMYSSNPADRLVLIDKVLRHEGEEVAPGLVLEKLLPKGAVFSFRGYRYRVAF